MCLFVNIHNTLYPKQGQFLGPEKQHIFQQYFLLLLHFEPTDPIIERTDFSDHHHILRILRRKKQVGWRPVIYTGISPTNGYNSCVFGLFVGAGGQPTKKPIWGGTTPDRQFAGISKESKTPGTTDSKNINHLAFLDNP